MSQNVLGVIGGSGFYQMKGLDKVELMELETPFGRPSDPFYQGRIGDIEVVFLARHGRGHRVLPSEINFRANVFGMKQLGVTHLVSVSTAGSLKEEIHPGELVRISLSTVRSSAPRRFSATAWWFTFRWPILYARISRAIWWARPARVARKFMTLAHTCAWRVRNFRRAPNRICIEAGARALSA